MAPFIFGISGQVVWTDIAAGGAMCVVTGACYVFSGSFEVSQARTAPPGWPALFLCVLFCSVAFGLVVGLGFHRQEGGAVVGIGIGLGLGFSNWYHQLARWAFGLKNKDARAAFGRAAVMVLAPLIYVVPLIFALLAIVMFISIVEWAFDALDRLATAVARITIGEDRLGRIVIGGSALYGRLPADQQPIWFRTLVKVTVVLVNQVPTFAMFYVVGAAIGLLCRPLIALAFHSGVGILSSFALMFVTGLFAGSTFSLVTQLRAWLEKPQRKRGEDPDGRVTAQVSHNSHLHNASLIAG